MLLHESMNMPTESEPDHYFACSQIATVKEAELLDSTTMKVIEIANAVGYENQGKFAKAFAETYGAPPEFRRLSK